MRLTFPNGEHPDVVESSRITFGSAADSMVRLDGLAERHALLANDRRGLWLVIESGDAAAHVNARPVSRLALVRPGDLISLGRIQVLLRSESDPKTPMLPPAAEAMTTANPGSSAVCPERFVLRCVGGTNSGRSFPLCQPVIVGRSESADIRIDEPTIGERQTRVEINGDRVVMRDFGGGEGPMLNGVPVRNAVLVGGDQIAWEQNRFVLEAPGLLAPAQQRHDTTPVPQTAANSGVNMHTPRQVTGVFAATPPPAANETPAETESRGGSVWWLIAAAAALGTLIAALLLYAPKLGG